MIVAQAILWTVAVYAGIGAVFGTIFVTRGVGTIDPAARGAPAGFRLLIFPGCVAFWPLLARRWWRELHR
jgi:hypothetical protein